MIPPKARLSCEQTASLENALDYIKHEALRVGYRRSILKAPVEELNGIRVTKNRMAKMKATMRIGIDFVGSS